MTDKKSSKTLPMQMEEARRRLEEAGFARSELSQQNNNHCLVGWAFQIMQEKTPPPTRRQRIKSTIRTVRYNADIVRTVLRHPLTDHCLDTGEGW